MGIFFPKPQNSSQGWWPMGGTRMTSAGVAVNEEVALKYTAVWCATRILSESLAALPLNLFEVIGPRNKQKAEGHPLHQLLHDEPNPEQDSMVWFDQQMQALLNHGNAFAEKQMSGRNVQAIWPIHPTRIPRQNIKRNESHDPRSAEIGKPGELIYWVNNDDGSKTPLPASRILHVPGVLTGNGLYGKGVIEWGANAIGRAVATEEHAASFFRNGAVSNVVLKHPRTLSETKAKTLREQWQRVYGGSENHYKAVVLEDGMEAQAISYDAKQAAMIESSNFSITDISRLYRIPPHMLADLSRSTFNNVEASNLSFVIHSLIPWVVRFEKAFRRQLLTPQEKGRFKPTFNVTGLLRGDMKARAEFYTKLFNMGALSPDDIRELEGQNAVDGGDQYFVRRDMVSLNNAGAIPVSESAASPNDDLAIEEDPRNAAVTATRAAMQGTLAGMVDYECRAAMRAVKQPNRFVAWMDSFYETFGEKLIDAMRPFEPAAKALGVNLDVEALAEKHTLHSRNTFDDLLDLEPERFTELVAAVTTDWSNRAAAMIADIFEEQECHA